MINHIIKHYKKVLLATFVLLLGVIFYLFSSYLNFPDSSLIIGNEENDKTNLYPEKNVLQVFEAQKNNLSGISIPLSDVSLRASDKIILVLADQNCKDIIRTQNITWFSYMTRIYYRFNFDPIFDSAGKKYCLRIKFDPKDKKIKKSDLPEVQTINDGRFGENHYHNENDPRPDENRALAMKPSYGSQGLWQKLSTLNQRMSQYKPWFLKEGYLTSIFAISMFFCIILVLVFVTL